DQAADHRDGVDQATVGADQVVAHVVAEPVVLEQVQQQQRLHPVEGEALPHLGEETDENTLRVAEEVAAGGRGRMGCGGQGRVLFGLSPSIARQGATHARGFCACRWWMPSSAESPWGTRTYEYASTTRPAADRPRHHPVGHPRGDPGRRQRL